MAIAVGMRHSLRLAGTFCGSPPRQSPAFPTQCEARSGDVDEPEPSLKGDSGLKTALSALDPPPRLMWRARTACQAQPLQRTAGQAQLPQRTACPAQAASRLGGRKQLDERTQFIRKDTNQQKEPGSVRQPTNPAAHPIRRRTPGSGRQPTAPTGERRSFRRPGPPATSTAAGAPDRPSNSANRWPSSPPRK